MAGKSKRKQTQEGLMLQLKLAGYEQQFLIDHVEEYMIYYDNLGTLNQRLLDNSLDTKTYNEILKEKRQVTKEMRNILSFLKLQPVGEGGSPSGGDGYEAL